MNSAPRPQRSLLWKTLQAFLRVFTSLWFDLKTYGVQRVPQTGGVLLVTNHQSFLDPILVGVRLLRPVSYMARHTLFETPLFGRLIRALHAFPVQRGKSDVAAFRQTIRRLQQGYVLNIFPEGTRSLDGQLQPMQKGIGLIVRQAGVPVIPVVIDGSFQAWPKNHKLFRPHPIVVQYGLPLRVESLKADQIVVLIESTLRQMIEELREKHPRPRV